MATQPYAVVATASAVCVGVDAAASTSGRRVVVGSGRKGAQSLASRRSIVLGSFVTNGALEEQRQRAVVVRAAKDGSIFAKGTQFFKLGGRKEEADEEEEEEAAPSGTQFFSGLGGWGKKAAEKNVEDEEEANEKPALFGTQRLRFGTKRGSVDSGNGAAKGGALVKKESTALDALPFGRGRRNDPKTVFVAGATGQIGARISQQLLHSGFTVRGGVRDIYFAQQLAEFATQYGVRSLTT